MAWPGLWILSQEFCKVCSGLSVREMVWTGSSCQIAESGDTRSGHCFHLLSLSDLLLIKSPWVRGVDYQLVSDLVTESHCVTPRSS